MVQARVDEDLDETLREAAKKQRVSVSQLIRNVLEDTFHLVDNVVARAAHLTETVVRDAKQIGASARGETRDEPDGKAESNSKAVVKAQPAAAEVSRPALLDAVAAWQSVIMNQGAACARCQNALPRGANAMLGIFGEAGQAPVWLCVPCAGAL